MKRNNEAKNAGKRNSTSPFSIQLEESGLMDNENVRTFVFLSPAPDIEVCWATIFDDGESPELIENMLNEGPCAPCDTFVLRVDEALYQSLRRAALEAYMTWPERTCGMEAVMAAIATEHNRHEYPHSLVRRLWGDHE